VKQRRSTMAFLPSCGEPSSPSGRSKHDPTSLTVRISNVDRVPAPDRAFSKF
jgi:hypothetical protein